MDARPGGSSADSAPDVNVDVAPSSGWGCGGGAAAPAVAQESAKFGGAVSHLNMLRRRSSLMLERVVLFALFGTGVGLIAYSSNLKFTFVNAAGRCASTQLWSNNVGKLLLCVVHGGVLFIFAKPLIGHPRRAHISGFASSATTLRRLLRDQTMRLSVAILVYLVTSILGLANAVDPSTLYVLFSAQNAAGMWAACAAAAATSRSASQGGLTGGSTSSSTGRNVTIGGLGAPSTGNLTGNSSSGIIRGSSVQLSAPASSGTRASSSMLLASPLKGSGAVGSSSGRLAAPAGLSVSTMELRD
ncbi:hypothetical protein H9P43_002344 [Blastocladiella emersonii ATCC 22665]|nr:hypothetical protein H9P43_002344 [Blastocladiella emersonii ATCC 22665]